MVRLPEMIAIVGPTASGKTHLATALAARLSGEVISADSRQVYRGMDLGTGKDLEEYHVDGTDIPFHLIDIVDAGERYTVYDYQRDFLEVYDAMKGRGVLPIFCGGSGLYLDAVLKGYHLVEVPADEALRERLSQLNDAELIARLASLRPLHNTTDVTDRQRLTRAIEVAIGQDKAKGQQADFPQIVCPVFGLNWPRAELKERITARLKARLAEGMLEEVQRLLDSGLKQEQLTYYGLEYKFLTLHLTGELNRNDMIQKLRSAIVGLAKRQQTWFRRMEKQGQEIHWLDGATSLTENLAYILQAVGSKHSTGTTV
jgi:tRNA dimethylallyltransferase